MHHYNTSYDKENIFETVLFFFLDIDECASGPCQNSVGCNDQVNSYTCNCQPGWTGIHCETSKKYFESGQNVKYRQEWTVFQYRPCP